MFSAASRTMNGNWLWTGTNCTVGLERIVPHAAKATVDNK